MKMATAVFRLPAYSCLALLASLLGVGDAAPLQKALLIADQSQTQPAPLVVAAYLGFLQERQGQLATPELLVPHRGDAGEDIIDNGMLGFAPMTSLIWCMSGLAALYFLLGSMLAAVRLAEHTQGAESPSALRRTLEAAELTLNFSPVLCVLFLAAQMQAMHVSHGREDPPRYIRICFLVATAALFLQSLLAMLAPLVTGMAPDIDGDAMVVVSKRPWVSVLSHVAMMAMCGASLCICIGTLLLQQPAFASSFIQYFLNAHHESSLSHEVTCPAVRCTVSLSAQFIVVHVFLAAVAASMKDSKQRSNSKLFQVLKLAAETAFLAPVLCVLFIAAKVRALQVYPLHGTPQPWAHVAFYVCNAALLMQLILVIVVPFLPGGDVKRGSRLIRGDVEIVFTRCDYGLLRLGIAIVRYIPSMLLLAGVGVVIASIMLLKADDRSTPTLPPTLQCTIVLTLLFIVVYLFLWIAIVTQNMLRRTGSSKGRRGIETMNNAFATVRFCPMLAILFVTLRLRAQEITGNTGSPQGWAQEAMYCCTIAAVTQATISILVGFLIGISPELGTSKDRRKEAADPWLCKVFFGQHVLCSLVMFAGAVVVCVALFIITTETAGGHGSLLGPVSATSTTVPAPHLEPARTGIVRKPRVSPS